MRDILVIDDDPVFGQLIMTRLELAGLSCALHLGPFGTMAAIRQVQPRVVILDVTMPGLDGTRISEMISKQRNLSEMKVLLYSSLSPSELEPLVTAHRAHASLNKSASQKQFIACVEDLMRTARRANQL